MSCNTLKDALSAELVLHATQSETLKQLLTNGADINFQSEEGWCLLFELVSLNLYEEIVALRDTTLNLNIIDNKGRNALFWSIYHEHPKVTKTLIDMGCNLQTDVIDGLPALHYAVYRNNRETVTLLMNKGIDLNCSDRYGNTALEYAYLYHREEMISILEEKNNHL